MKYPPVILFALSAFAQNTQSSVLSDYNPSPNMNYHLADGTMINLGKLTPEVRMAYAKKAVAMIASQNRTNPEQIKAQFQNLIDAQTDDEMKTAVSDACKLWMQMHVTPTAGVPLTKEEMIQRHKAVFQALIDAQVDPEAKQAYQNQWAAWLKAANI